MNKRTLVIGSGLLLIVLFAAGVFGYRAYQAKRYGFMAQENASTFVRPHSMTLGSDDAKVYLVEFSDPACETCAAFHPIIEELMAEYPGKIKLVYRYAPFHAGSDQIVKMLEAARVQGKFWDALAVMYNTQRYWASHHNPNPELLWRFLPRAGVDIKKLRADMNNPEIEKIIAQDLADGKALNVRKTPGFFVNGKPLIRFGRTQLVALVQSEIEAVYGSL